MLRRAPVDRLAKAQTKKASRRRIRREHDLGPQLARQRAGVHQLRDGDLGVGQRRPLLRCQVARSATIGAARSGLDPFDCGAGALRHRRRHRAARQSAKGERSSDHRVRENFHRCFPCDEPYRSASIVRGKILAHLRRERLASAVRPLKYLPEETIACAVVQLTLVV